METSTSPLRVASVQDLPGILLRVAIPACLLFVGGLAFWYLAIPEEKAKAPPAEAPAIQTHATKLLRQDYTVVVKTNGIVQAHNEVGLSSQVAGVVRRVSPEFAAGAYFAKGDILVELDERDFRTAVSMAAANQLSAEAGLDLAAETHQRNESLFLKKGVSQAVLKQSLAAKAQAEAQLQTASAQLEQAERDLERTKVRAPFHGRVRQISVGKGQTVGAGAPLGVVFAIDYAEIRLPIASKERRFLNLPELQTDVPLEVELRDGINTNSSVVWKANITRTEGALDANSLELFAIARIDDPFGRKSGRAPLRIGQPVIASIPGKTLDNIVAIPRPAVRQLDQVFLINDGQLLNHKLDPIWTDAQYLIVDDPSIRDGQLLATTRIVYAPDGAKVEIIPEMELTSHNSKHPANTMTKTVAN